MDTANSQSPLGSLPRLALPIIVQNFLTYGVAVADNLMVGRLGEEKISGLFFGNQVFALLQILLFGIECAVVILGSQYWGQRNLPRIREVLSIAVRLGAGCGLVAGALAVCAPRAVIGLMTDDPAIIGPGAEYLRIAGFSYIFFGATQMLIAAMRSVESVRIGMFDAALALIVNVSLNYVLINGYYGFPRLEVRGAALGTLLTRGMELAMVLFFVLRLDRRLDFRPGGFRLWSPEIFHDLCRYGWPLMAGQIVWAANIWGQTWIIGRLGAAVAAGVSLAGMANHIISNFVFGLASGVGITTGKLIGAESFAAVKCWAQQVQVIFIACGVLAGALVYASQDLLLECYKLKPEAVDVARTLLIVTAVTVVGRCYQAPCLLGLVKSGGDTAFVFKNDTFFVFAVVLPSAYIALRLDAAPWVIYACLLSDQILKCFVAVWKINSFNWMRKLTRK